MTDTRKPTKTRLESLLANGVVPYVTASIMALWLASMSPDKRKAWVRKVNPQFNLATDEHASLRFMYLRSRYGWAMEYAAASPEWLDKVGMRFAFWYFPLMLVNTIITAVLKVVMDALIFVVSILTTLVIALREMANTVERGLFGRSQLRKAQAACLTDEAAEYVMRKGANIRDDKFIPPSVRIKHHETVREMDRMRAEALGSLAKDKGQP